MHKVMLDIHTDNSMPRTFHVTTLIYQQWLFVFYLYMKKAYQIREHFESNKRKRTYNFLTASNRNVFFTNKKVTGFSLPRTENKQIVFLYLPKKSSHESDPSESHSPDLSIFGLRTISTAHKRDQFPQKKNAPLFSWCT